VSSGYKLFTFALLHLMAFPKGLSEADDGMRAALRAVSDVERGNGGDGRHHARTTSMTSAGDGPPGGESRNESVELRWLSPFSPPFNFAFGASPTAITFANSCNSLGAPGDVLE
jgi:hypothetical protein